MRHKPEIIQTNFYDFNSRTSCEVRPESIHLNQPTFYFNSRTSCEVRRTKFPPELIDDNFNSRTSCEVRRAIPHQAAPPPEISTHAPLARCDVNSFIPFSYSISFQLTHLLRGATTAGQITPRRNQISTHAPLARCDRSTSLTMRATRISTHAPLARCDQRYRNHPGFGHISTHAPLARCDPGALHRADADADFNSRTSCEVRHGPESGPAPARPISTHAPLARCDPGDLWIADARHDFNSRTSCEVRQIPGAPA